MFTFTTSQALTVRYEVHGTHGPAVILLHGLGSSAKLWTPQISVLKQYFRVIALDFPGHGGSDWTRFYSIGQLATLVNELMDHLGVREAHFVGLSLGCAVALTLACRAPHRVLSLVLQSPVGGLRPASHPLGKVALAGLKAYMGLLFFLWRCFGKERAVHFINKYGFQTYGYYPLLKNIQQQADPLAIWHLAHEIAYPPYVGRLSGIQVPAVIIAGKGDITPPHCIRYIQHNLEPACPVIRVPGCRHIVSIEKPLEFNSLVLGFLTQLGASSQPTHTLPLLQEAQAGRLIHFSRWAAVKQPS